MEELKITQADILSHGVQSLPDTLGGTAAENKAAFDALVSDVVKEKFNALIDALSGEGGAGQIGIRTVTGLSAGEVQSALEQMMSAMQSVTQGAVADASITLTKLAAEVTAAALGGAPSVHTHDASDITSGELAAERIPTLPGEKIADGAVTGAKLGAAAVTENKIGVCAVKSVHIAPLAVTSGKISYAAVTGEKIEDGAVTEEKLAEDLSYTAVNLTADQVRTITVGTAEPSGGADGDIYLLIGE